MHEALLAVLCRHLGLAQLDDEVQRLAVCLTGLAVHLHVGRDVIDTLAPQLNRSADSAAAWSDCLLRQGLAMVDHERLRRLVPRAGALAVASAAPAGTAPNATTVRRTS
jgi:hypothetical protein